MPITRSHGHCKLKLGHTRFLPAARREPVLVLIQTMIIILRFSICAAKAADTARTY